MDKKSAVEQVLAAYEKLTRQNSRIKALEKKLADGTISLKEGAELNDLRARAFGRAFSGKVLDITQGEREGTCTALLRGGCNDVDELAQAAQRAVLARQGLNLTPPTAPFEEERARKIGHSLEDQTVPDETIERRAKSATETMLRSQYDRNMERGAKTCASAGLKTSIIRDADPGCCKWCSDVAGRYTYGEEPKDVYRRHDNCSCTVVYESGRGRQNVWSKQYWSAEQEQKYLELRDELKAKKMTAAPDVKKPVRLSEKEVQAIINKVGGTNSFAQLTFGENGGRINTEKAFRKEGDDPMFEVTGRAIDSNPREIEEMEKRLKEWGVEINRGQNTLAYGSPANGRPGTMSITDDASFSAWKHEFKHAEDDKNAGWNAVYVLWNDPAEHERRERRAYEEEIKLAREAGREDIAKRLEANRDAEIERIWKAYRKYHGDT